MGEGARHRRIVLENKVTVSSHPPLNASAVHNAPIPLLPRPRKSSKLRSVQAEYRTFTTPTSRHSPKTAIQLRSTSSVGPRPLGSVGKNRFQPSCRRHAVNNGGGYTSS